MCLAGVASVVASDACPEDRWMVTMPHKDCHQFYVCVFGRSMELKCPFGLYWDPIEGGCGRKVPLSCEVEVAPRVDDEVPHPPISTTSWPPHPDFDTSPATETEETDTTDATDTTDGDTTIEGDASPTPPFSTTGNTPTPPFSTTGETPTPEVSTTDAQPTPPVSTTPDENETGTPPEATTSPEVETTTEVDTGTPPVNTTGEYETTTEVETGTPPVNTTGEYETTTAQPPPVTPPTCPAQGNHFFRDYTSCSHFFLCQNGQLIHMMCAPGQIFDQTYLRCRHDGVCVL
ncbi:hypothetical protein DMENIID0001_021330 [Sergentomyia squamirostris]